ncbi:MAG: type II toxin-antitoxin system VapC family toxin [Gemmatimonadetes bacterium]|uniref:Ribonuclease VapC n=1 Tax=Candidatus Kutchimonas denitrificans TaxID=3056748 RepID=A0AAE4Z9T4_9BACT|nr:type II toxin-antitoxin system VapC family toxin [Gemmatimonadota bacterium]NIR74781.1 type II toxin-antitoxin system VapC family toxin [Candidatus Kutchimonas denitrificans]NIS01531.1 type II toxin-antitoxin system VapC family toxin [Gemmatimonadota bacterium]NIT67272.1 type II toxin-antitoxin system VapC family toxin [Gemmatimonadota bacterium]NIU52446.1 PIN domain-containing protein [Gemmatimonadota bacterium]
MIAVDTNVLVVAHRSGLGGHERALAWLRSLAEGNVPWGIPVFCLGEFVRVVTHPRVLDPPSSLDAALEALSGLLESPTLRLLSPGPNYAPLFAQAVRAADARGNLAFDAQIAAVCREHGAGRLLTLDWDFARFPGLRIVGLGDPPSP